MRWPVRVKSPFRAGVPAYSMLSFQRRRGREGRVEGKKAIGALARWQAENPSVSRTALVGRLDRHVTSALRVHQTAPRRHPTLLCCPPPREMPRGKNTKEWNSAPPSRRMVVLT